MLACMLCLNSCSVRWQTTIITDAGLAADKVGPLVTEIIESLKQLQSA